MTAVTSTALTRPIPAPRAIGLGDASTDASSTPSTSVTVNTAGVSWAAMFLIAAGAFAAGGAVVYFMGPELGLEPMAREEEEEP